MRGGNLQVWECVGILGAGLFSWSYFLSGLGLLQGLKHLRQFRCLNWKYNCCRPLAFGAVTVEQDQHRFPYIGWSNKTWFICSASLEGECFEAGPILYSVFIYSASSKRAVSSRRTQVRRMGIRYIHSACNPVVKAVAQLPSLLEDKNFGQLPRNVSRL